MVPILKMPAGEYTFRVYTYPAGLVPVLRDWGLRLL